MSNATWRWSTLGLCGLLAAQIFGAIFIARRHGGLQLAGDPIKAELLRREKACEALEKQCEVLKGILQTTRGLTSSDAVVGTASPAAHAKDSMAAARARAGVAISVNRLYAILLRQWSLVPGDEAFLRELLVHRTLSQRSGKEPPEVRENRQRQIDELLWEHIGHEKFEALMAYEASLPLRAQLEQAAKLLRRSDEPINFERVEELVQLHQSQNLKAASPRETVDQIEALLPLLSRPLTASQLAAIQLANVRQRALSEMSRRVQNQPASNR